MRLVTPREPFLHHLQLAASVCPTRSPRPILQDVLVHASDGKVEFVSTDGEVSLRTWYEADGIKGEGSAAFPAITLLSAVRSMADDQIKIDEKGSLHEISCGHAVFKLNGDDPEMFPLIPTVDAKTAVTVPVKDFVLLEVDPDEMTVVATDGRRLALARLEGKTGVSKRQTRILPVKGLAQLQRAGSEAADDAMLRIGLLENQVAFALPFTEIVAQLVEGEFPDFRAVLPKDTDAPEKVVLDREELASAIRRAAVTAGEGARSVELNFSGGRLSVTSRQEGVGESRSEMPVEYDGDEVGIRFNPEFLGDYLKGLPEASVDFRFKDRASAGVFTGKDDSVYVVMPITS
jgi:DNA polymerase-3 subunit beta